MARKKIEDMAPWQARAARAGLSQTSLCELLGRAQSTISRQLTGQWQSGTPLHVIAVILAWEIMTLEQRIAWHEAVSRERQKEKG